MTTAQERPNGSHSSPPPCPAENSQHENASKDSVNNFNRSRCQFTYSDGRRCANERAYLCVHHASKREAGFGAEGAPDAALVGLCSDLTSATNINRALTQVFLLMAQGRISQKQAVAFGYITQLLLQTVPGVRAEFVSAYGYANWEENLKASLERHGKPDGNDAQNDSSAEPLNKEHLSEEVLSKGPTEADFESLYARTVDLFEGKYDLTPEGRAEARILNYELELLKSAKSAPPKGRVGEVVNLVRHINKGMNPAPPKPRNVDFYGNPKKPADWWQSDHPTRMVIPSEKLERGISPNPSGSTGGLMPNELRDRTTSPNPLSASTHMAYVSSALRPPPDSPAGVTLSESATADERRISPNPLQSGTLRLSGRVRDDSVVRLGRDRTPRPHSRTDCHPEPSCAVSKWG